MIKTNILWKLQQQYNKLENSQPQIEKPDDTENKIKIIEKK